MKIRNGFVSNSSSSSFVIVGFKLNDLSLDNDKKRQFMSDCNYSSPSLEKLKTIKNEQTQEFQDELNEVFYDFLYRSAISEKWENIEYLSDDGPGYLGMILINVTSVDSVDDKEWEVSEIATFVKPLEDYFGIKSKVYCGTRSC